MSLRAPKTPPTDALAWSRWTRAQDTGGASDAAAAIAEHEAKADPHPVYATDADLAAHVAALDPHPGYVLDTDLIATRVMDARTAEDYAFFLAD